MTKEKKPMTVVEAGRKGGTKVRDERGHDFYVEIGKKGGSRVQQLIAAGKAAEAKAKRKKGDQ